MSYYRNSIKLGDTGSEVIKISDQQYNQLINAGKTGLQITTLEELNFSGQELRVLKASTEHELKITDNITKKVPFWGAQGIPEYLNQNKPCIAQQNIGAPMTSRNGAVSSDGGFASQNCTIDQKLDIPTESLSFSLWRPVAMFEYDSTTNLTTIKLINITTSTSTSYTTSSECIMVCLQCPGGDGGNAFSQSSSTYGGEGGAGGYYHEFMISPKLSPNHFVGIGVRASSWNSSTKVRGANHVKVFYSWTSNYDPGDCAIYSSSDNGAPYFSSSAEDLRTKSINHILINDNNWFVSLYSIAGGKGGYGVSVTNDGAWGYAASGENVTRAKLYDIGINSGAISSSSHSGGARETTQNSGGGGGASAWGHGCSFNASGGYLYYGGGGAGQSRDKSIDKKTGGNGFIIVLA